MGLVEKDEEDSLVNEIFGEFLPAKNALSSHIMECDSIWKYLLMGYSLLLHSLDRCIIYLFIATKY